MSFSLYIVRRAQKELARLPPETYERVRFAIRGLAANPRPPGSRKLTARNGWRLRVGDYRVIYEIEDVNQTATILHVGHRRDVYQ